MTGAAPAMTAAERRAKYNRLRGEGLSILDAGVRLGVSDATAYRYERWRHGGRRTAPDLVAQRQWAVSRGR